MSDHFADLSVTVHGASKHDATVVVATSGSIAGNNTVNRAIPHGLGREPLDVKCMDNQDRVIHIHKGHTYFSSSATDADYAVTAADSVNFYVGNATSYPQSANGTGITVNWVAV